MKNIVKKKAGKNLSKMRKNKDKDKIREKEFAKVLEAIIELR